MERATIGKALIGLVVLSGSAAGTYLVVDYGISRWSTPKKKVTSVLKPEIKGTQGATSGGATGTASTGTGTSTGGAQQPPASPAAAQSVSSPTQHSS